MLASACPRHEPAMTCSRAASVSAWECTPNLRYISLTGDFGQCLDRVLGCSNRTITHHAPPTGRYSSSSKAEVDLVTVLTRHLAAPAFVQILESLTG